MRCHTCCRCVAVVGGYAAPGRLSKSDTLMLPEFPDTHVDAISETVAESAEVDIMSESRVL